MYQRGSQHFTISTCNYVDTAGKEDPVPTVGKLKRIPRVRGTATPFELPPRVSIGPPPVIHPDEPLERVNVYRKPEKPARKKQDEPKKMSAMDHFLAFMERDREKHGDKEFDVV